MKKKWADIVSSPSIKVWELIFFCVWNAFVKCIECTMNTSILFWSWVINVKSTFSSNLSIEIIPHQFTFFFLKKQFKTIQFANTNFLNSILMSLFQKENQIFLLFENENRDKSQCGCFHILAYQWRNTTMDSELNTSNFRNNLKEMHVHVCMI